jgi:hypothetical protein
VSQYPYHHHTGARALKKHFDENQWEWNDYLSLTTIRNPWDRVVSIYQYSKKQTNSIWNKLYLKTNSFDRFVEALPDFLNEVVYAGGHLKAGQRGISISEFGFSQGGDRLINHIIPIEQIDKKLPEILNELGLPAIEVPRVNGTVRGTYHEYYTNVTQEIVSEIFREDIELGKYFFK